MTTPETPKLNDPSPVLGVDPPAPKPAAPAPTPVVPTTPAPIGGVTVTQDEFDSLQDRAASYDTLSNDPQVSALIANHLQQRAAGVVTPAPEPAPSSPGGDPNANPYEDRLVRVENFLQQGAQAFQQLQRENVALRDEVGTLRTDRFSESNPSFKQNERAVAKLCQDNPGLTLTDALMLVEARALKAGNGTVDGGHPATPTTEGAGAGSLPSDSGGNTDEARLADLAQRINDPKATPSMDSALDAIGEAFGVNG